MLQRPKFEDHIAFPYVRHMSPEGTLGDIFDGRIWKDLRDESGESFLPA